MIWHSNIRMPNLRLNSKQFFLTYPKCSLDPVLALERFKQRVERWGTTIQKYVVAQESHIDGSLHLHSYLGLSNVLNLKDAHCWDIASGLGDDCISFHGNYQTARSVNNVIKYCIKGGNYITNCEEQINEIRKRRTRQEDAARVISFELPLLQYLQDHPSLHLLGQYCRLKAALLAVKSDQKPTTNRPQICGKWLVGPPRSGKSFAARFGIKPDETPYVKDQTKWWDNYQGQSVVILDDLSPPSKQSALSIQDLAYYLKIWTDRYETHGEIKGLQGGCRLSYKTFVVTSNYTIEQIFGYEDQDLLKALNRRFVIIGLSGINEVSDIVYPDQYELSNTQTEFEKFLNSKNEVKMSIEEDHQPQNPKDVS